jgi:[CysO sulfur-carrier protein]-S-L-cysteine hydrolase
VSLIRIRAGIPAELLVYARRVPEQECCGLLAGRDGAITHVFAAMNAASDPSISYEIAPGELFRLMRGIRAAGLALMGIYHSHPHGENDPSARDIERAYYPDAAYFVLSPREDAPRPVRAFSIREGHSREVEIQIF